MVVSNGFYDNMVSVAKGKSIKNNSNSKFEPPAFWVSFSVKNILKYIAYCYILAIQ